MLFLDKEPFVRVPWISCHYAEYQSATRYSCSIAQNFYRIFTKFLRNFYEIFLPNFSLWGFLSTQFFSLGVFQALWFFSMWNHLAHRKFQMGFCKHSIFWCRLQIELRMVHKSWNCEKLHNCCDCKKLTVGTDDPKKFSEKFLILKL